MKKALPIIALVTFIALMLARPNFYMLSAEKGLAIFATSVLPALFPFFFCAIILTKIGAVETMSKIGKRPVKFLFNSPPEGAYVFMLSVLSGYPTGSAMLADLYDNNLISSAQAKSMFAYASTSGPIFILGTLGSAIFNNANVGIIVLAAHYLAAIANGILFRLRKKNDVQSENVIMPLISTSNILGDAIAKSTVAMLAVGGYIMLAGMLVDTLELFRVNELIMSALPANSAQPIVSFLYGLLEMTRGGIECAKIENIHIAVALAAFAVSFGGLSVLLQSATFMARCKVKFGALLLRKTTQAVFAFIFALLFSLALK